MLIPCFNTCVTLYTFFSLSNNEFNFTHIIFYVRVFSGFMIYFANIYIVDR